MTEGWWGYDYPEVYETQALKVDVEELKKKVRKLEKEKKTSKLNKTTLNRHTS